MVGGHRIRRGYDALSTDHQVSYGTGCMHSYLLLVASLLLAPVRTLAVDLDFSSGTFLGRPPGSGDDFYTQDDFVVEIENVAHNTNMASCPGRWCFDHGYTTPAETTLVTNELGRSFDLLSIQVTQNGNSGLSFSADGGAFLNFKGVGTVNFGPEFLGITTLRIDIPCSGQYNSCFATIDNVLIALCGNGVVEGVEQCDDGNTLPGDGCDPGCSIEASSTTTTTSSSSSSTASSSSVSTITTTTSSTSTTMSTATTTTIPSNGCGTPFADNFENGTLAQWTVIGRQQGTGSAAVVARNGSQVAQVSHQGFTEIALQRVFDYEATYVFQFDIEVQVTSEPPPASNYYASGGMLFTFLDASDAVLGYVAYLRATTNSVFDTLRPDPTREAIEIPAGMNHYRLAAADIANLITIDTTKVARIAMSAQSYGSTNPYPSVSATTWFDNVMVDCGFTNTTTTLTSSTTSTTLGACTGVRCLLDGARRGESCADEEIPSGIDEKLDRAIVRAELSPSSTPRKARRLVQSARRTLKAAAKATTKAAKRRRAKLSEECAQDIQAAIAQALAVLSR